MKEIRFYNNFHNGDIHMSREFIKDVRKKIHPDMPIYYHHRNSQSILKDVPDIIQWNGGPLGNDYLYYVMGETLYINTWIGQQNRKYMEFECSLPAIYSLWVDIFNLLSINMEPLEFYVPSVDFNFIQHDYRFYADVLICNNMPMSNQANSFNFDFLIDYLSSYYPNMMFIITNPTKIRNKNIKMASDIIGKDTDNLLEISYLSTKCRIIIGRGSGPSVFTLIKENIYDASKIFIHSTFNEYNGKLIPESIGSCKQFWMDDINYTKIKEIIDNE